eukprot:gene2759-19799_t
MPSADLAHAQPEALPICAAEDSIIPLRRPPSFHPNLCEPVTKKRDSAARRKEVALLTIARLPPAQVRVCTDGSVLVPRCSRHGGGAYVLNDGSDVQHRGRIAAGEWCNSCQAEKLAMLHALRSLLNDRTIAVPQGAEIKILTDSQAAIRALERGPHCQGTILGQRIWAALCGVGRRFDAHVTIAYTPGHVGIEQQEEADEEAKEAARDAVMDLIYRADDGEAERDPTPLPLDVAMNVLQSYFRSEQRSAVERDSHWWETTQGDAPKWPKGISRAQERILAQLRAGKCPITAQYKHLIAATECACDDKRRKRVESGCVRCPAAGCLCGAPMDSVRHLVLECPLYEQARQEMMTPKTGNSMTILAQEPERVLTSGAAGANPTLKHGWPHDHNLNLNLNLNIRRRGAAPRRGRQIPLIDTMAMVA